jgi:hypothetical protein
LNLEEELWRLQYHRRCLWHNRVSTF